MAEPSKSEKKIRGATKTRVGVVVSDKADKTVAVSIERMFKHPLYHKFIRKTRKLMAHDEENRCAMGDTVRVVETRPRSKRKRWRVVEILRRSE